MKRVIRLFITVLCLMLLLGCNHSPEPRKCSSDSFNESSKLNYDNLVIVVDDYSRIPDGDESELEAIVKNRCDAFDELSIVE